MAFEFSAFAALAIVLGVKHAFDADHLVAVSSLLTRQHALGRTTGLAASWAMGHLLTAAMVSALIYFVADAFLLRWIGRMETLVPIMLILVGLLGLGMELKRLHIHRHRHVPEGPAHQHFHVHVRPGHQHGAMAGIGVVHGLASNDELLLVLLVGLGAGAWWQVLLGVALFSVGVLIGMVAYASGVHTLTRRSGLPWMPAALGVTFSVLSIAYAVYLLAGGAGLTLLTWQPSA
jgi:hypothetical protein